jgi:hypothetical protein
LTVIGEPRAAVASRADIPMASTCLLIGLAITLAVIGLIILRD